MSHTRAMAARMNYEIAQRDIDNLHGYLLSAAMIMLFALIVLIGLFGNKVMDIHRRLDRLEQLQPTPPIEIFPQQSAPHYRNWPSEGPSHGTA